MTVKELGAQSTMPLLTNQSGLTKREYFAAMAMQGIVSSLNGQIMLEKVSKFAIMQADALLEELAKTE
jgi:predicted HTH domain antitoxin